MPRKSLLRIISAVFCGIVAVGLWNGAAEATLPPGYDPAGTVLLNPAHVGTVGSQFTQDCTGVPQPPPPGGVVWHFILPQSVLRGGTPINIFDTLTVTFATAGPVTLSAIADFGPPSQAHAYVTTPTDDTLTAGVSTIGRLTIADPLLGNDPQFNLSHTCALQLPPPTATTTTTTTTTTTAPSTTTTTSAPTTTSTTSSSSTAPTTAPTGSSTSTTSAVGPATSSQVSAAPTSASNIPITGRDGTSATKAALFALAVGFALVVVARLRTSSG